MTKKLNLNDLKDWVIIIFFVVVTLFIGVKVYYWAGDKVSKARDFQEFRQKLHNPQPTQIEEMKYEFSINDSKYEVNVKRVK